MATGGLHDRGLYDGVLTPSVLRAEAASTMTTMAANGARAGRSGSSARPPRRPRRQRIGVRDQRENAGQ
jgi:hypothetical protein